MDNSVSSQAITFSVEDGVDIDIVQAESSLPQRWDPSKAMGRTIQARMLKPKPDRGRAYTSGESRYTTVIFKDQLVQLLLDSGADCSIVGTQFLNRIYPDWRDFLLPIEGVKFRSCTSPLEQIGVIETDLIFPHLKESVVIRPEFVVCEKGTMEHFILGNDYLNLYGIDIHTSKGIFFTIGGGNQSKKFLFDHRKAMPKLPTPTITRLNEQVPPTEEVWSTHTESPDSEKQNEISLSEVIEDNLKSIDFESCKLGNNLDTSQILQLKELCLKFKHCFATENEPLSLIKDHEFDIELTVDRPYPPALRKPPYPLSPRAKEALEGLINDLLKLNIVRRVEPHEEVDVTTAVVIAWHNGKPRLVGDFRPLRMPFGVKNAPAYFQAMMDKEFGRFIQEGWLIVYIDDIIVATKTWEDHLIKLQQVFLIVQRMKMTISMKKCQFAHDKLVALGHVVSGLTIAIDQNKVAAVLLKPIPMSFKEMQSFLGFANYYRNHIQSYSKIAGCLYELLKAGVVYEMTEQRISAYQEMKKLLTSAPFLFMPKFEHKFLLYVDACMDGLGAALHQTQIVMDKPVEGPICFISRQLKDSEKRYGASQLECLCLVWALEKLHYYLDGSVFDVITDCTALKSLLNMQTANRHM